VGDVRLEDGREAIAHMPSLDMGGKCVPGVEVLLKPAIDKKTKQPIGDNALGKYGTPKCEFIIQLLRCTEPENADLAGGGGCWVGAHPSLGEKIAMELLTRGRLKDELGPIEAVKREAKGVAGTDMRVDFLLTHPGGRRTMVEVKTVVDTDYNPATAPEKPKGGCVFLGHGDPYQRAAIFPWGRSAQSGPDGEKVVSARAIKHVRELTAVASGEKGAAGRDVSACVLFVVVRRDALSFRPNAEACPSFSRYLAEARAAGVRVLARRVRWGEAALDGEEVGMAIDDGPLPVDTPAAAV